MFDDEKEVAEAIRKLKEDLANGWIKPREALIKFFELLLADQEKPNAD